VIGWVFPLYKGLIYSCHLIQNPNLGVVGKVDLDELLHLLIEADDEYKTLGVTFLELLDIDREYDSRVCLLLLRLVSRSNEYLEYDVTEGFTYVVHQPQYALEEVLVFIHLDVHGLE
jgi:hypothetical protein